MTGPRHFVVLDIDGTLLDEDMWCDPRLAPAIARMRRLGVRPILLTGRSLTGFLHCGLPVSLLAACDDAVLLYDGDVVFRRDLGVSACHATLPPDVAAQVLSDDSLRLVADDGTQLFASGRQAAMAYSMAYRLPRDAVTAGLAGISPGSVVRITIFGTVPEAVRSAGVAVSHIGPFGAAVLRPPGGGKAHRLAGHLATCFGVSDLTGVAAIGDGDNDAELLAACGLGVAVQGSSARASAAARVRLDGPLATYLAAFDLVGNWPELAQER